MQLKVIPVERYPHLMERLQAAEDEVREAFRNLVRFTFDIDHCHLMAERTYLGPRGAIALVTFSTNRDVHGVR
jgi:hypothetical protein